MAEETALSGPVDDIELAPERRRSKEGDLQDSTSVQFSRGKEQMVTQTEISSSFTTDQDLLVVGVSLLF
jgi:hypothetical protein